MSMRIPPATVGQGVFRLSAPLVDPAAVVDSKARTAGYPAPRGYEQEAGSAPQAAGRDPVVILVAPDSPGNRAPAVDWEQMVPAVQEALSILPDCGRLAPVFRGPPVALVSAAEGEVEAAAKAASG